MQVLCYIRYSSENQRDNNSVAAQKRALTEFCLANDYHIVDFYIDEAKSGTSTNREKFLDMIDRVKEGGIYAVVVHKLDRFARNQYDSAIYTKVLEEKGTKLISVLEPIISQDNPEAKLYKGMVESVNAYYSENLAREVAKGQKELALQKKSVFNRHYFGFDLLPDRTYRVNEEEAKYVKIAYEKYAEGCSLKSIAELLNSKGFFYQPKTHTPFDYRAVEFTLTNKMNIGTYCYRHRGHTDKIPPIFIENAYPPIVDDELFTRVNELLKEKKALRVHPRKYGENYNYLLTGYLKCGYCGANLTGGSEIYRYVDGSRKRVSKYRCKTTKIKGQHCDLKRFDKELLNDYVMYNLKTILFGAETTEKLLDLFKNKQPLKSKSVSEEENLECKKQITEFQNKRTRLLDLYLDGGIDKNTYLNKKNKLDTQIAILKNKITQTAKNLQELTAEDILNMIKRFKNDSDSYEANRELVETFIDYIEATNDHVVIHYKSIFVPTILPEISQSTLQPLW